MFSAPTANSTAPKKSLSARSLIRSAVKTEIEFGRFASFSLVRVPERADDAAYPFSSAALTSNGDRTTVGSFVVSVGLLLADAGAGLTGAVCAGRITAAHSAAAHATVWGFMETGSVSNGADCVAAQADV